MEFFCLCSDPFPSLPALHWIVEHWSCKLYVFFSFFALCLLVSLGQWEALMEDWKVREERSQHMPLYDFCFRSSFNSDYISFVVPSPTNRLWCLTTRSWILSFRDIFSLCLCILGTAISFFFVFLALWKLLELIPHIKLSLFSLNSWHGFYKIVEHPRVFIE